ncbi:MAG: AEC family transporter [Lachnospiraceae bacterium]|nr:AEC family transporter [Lachnospiraceae bacterium]
MESLLLALRLVFPMFCYMALGYFLQHGLKKPFFSEKGLKDINNLVFRVLLPLSVIQSIYNSNLKHGIDWLVMGFVFFATLAVFLLSWAVCLRLDKDPTRIPVLIQGISKSNYVLMGTSIAAMLFGSDIGMAGVLVAVTAPLNNTLSAICFEHFRGGKMKPAAMLKKILTNPIVAGGLIGIALNLLSVPVPSYFMTQVVSKLGGIATPLALIALGATFRFDYVSRFARNIGIVTAARLLLVPLIEIPLAIALGLRGVNLVAIAIVSATPTAVNSYSTAASMGGDAELAGAILAMTSVLSIVTMFLWISLVSGLGLL